MRVIDGHPVPFSLTVLPEDGEPEPDEAMVLVVAEQYLRDHGKEAAYVERIEGRYAYYRFARRVF